MYKSCGAVSKRLPTTRTTTKKKVQCNRQIKEKTLCAVFYSFFLSGLTMKRTVYIGCASDGPNTREALAFGGHCCIHFRSLKSLISMSLSMSK